MKQNKKKYVDDRIEFTRKRIIEEINELYLDIGEQLENYEDSEFKEITNYVEKELKKDYFIYQPNSFYNALLHEQEICDKESQYTKKRLSIGVDRFAKLINQNFTYVDKTKFIEELLENQNEVTLICRPRRFGKTLTLNMLYEFFRIDKNNQHLFKNTYITQTASYKQRNSYPTIFLTFKDCKGNKEEMLETLYTQLYKLYIEAEPIWRKIENKEVVEFLEQIFLLFKDRGHFSSTKSVLVATALQELSHAYYLYYQKPTIILLDEYDTPFIEAYTRGYYDEVKDFLASLYSQTLKGNEYLAFAVMTGIQRIAKENIFSGLNNLKVCTMNDEEYADCFGFTKEETGKLLSYYDLSLKEEVQKMYDGYRIGNQEIYNPWSIINYAQTSRLEPYWINTSNNALIKKILIKGDKRFCEAYDRLIQEGKTTVEMDAYASYEEMNVWTLFLSAGYLKIVEELGKGMSSVCFVNEEIKGEFNKLIGDYLHVSYQGLHCVISSLLQKDMEGFLEEYRSLLIDLPSYHDLRNENSYHMLMLGLCAMAEERYEIVSNREQGIGRSDLFLKAKIQKNCDIILEFKYSKDTHVDLHKLAMEALDQIKERYASENMFMVGIAHCGKNVEIAYASAKK